MQASDNVSNRGFGSPFIRQGDKSIEKTKRGLKTKPALHKTTAQTNVFQNIYPTLIKVGEPIGKVKKPYFHEDEKNGYYELEEFKNFLGELSIAIQDVSGDLRSYTNKTCDDIDVKDFINKNKVKLIRIENKIKSQLKNLMAISEDISFEKLLESDKDEKYQDFFSNFKEISEKEKNRILESLKRVITNIATCIASFNTLIDVDSLQEIADGNNRIDEISEMIGDLRIKVNEKAKNKINKLHKLNKMRSLIKEDILIKNKLLLHKTASTIEIADKIYHSQHRDDEQDDSEITSTEDTETVSSDEIQVSPESDSRLGRTLDTLAKAGMYVPGPKISKEVERRLKEKLKKQEM